MLRRRRYLRGHPVHGCAEISWCKPDGTEMSDDDWDAGFARSVGLFHNGQAIADRDRRGQRVTGDSLLLLFNAHHEPINWTLPKQWGQCWEPVLDTASTHPEGPLFKGGAALPVAARSVVMLRHRDKSA